MGAMTARGGAEARWRHAERGGRGYGTWRGTEAGAGEAGAGEAGRRRGRTGYTDSRSQSGIQGGRGDVP
jgi:hypothetical protein